MLSQASTSETEASASCSPPLFTFIAADGALVALPASLPRSTAVAHSLYLAAALDVGETEGVVPVALAPTLRLYVAYLQFRESLRVLRRVLSAEGSGSVDETWDMKEGSEPDHEPDRWWERTGLQHSPSRQTLSRPLRCDCGRLQPQYHRPPTSAAQPQPHEVLRPASLPPPPHLDEHVGGDEARAAFSAADFFPYIDSPPPSLSSPASSSSLTHSPSPPSPAAEAVAVPPSPERGVTPPQGEEAIDPTGEEGEEDDDWEREAAAADAAEQARAEGRSAVASGATATTAVAAGPGPGGRAGHDEGQAKGGAARTLVRDDDTLLRKSSPCSSSVRARPLHRTQCAGYDLREAVPDPMDAFFLEHIALDRRWEGGGRERLGNAIGASSPSTVFTYPQSFLRATRDDAPGSSSSDDALPAFLYDRSYYQFPTHAPPTSASTGLLPPLAPVSTSGGRQRGPGVRHGDGPSPHRPASTAPLSTTAAAPPGPSLPPLALSHGQQKVLLSLLTLADYLGDEHLALVCGRYLACWLANATESEMLASFLPDRPTAAATGVATNPDVRDASGAHGARRRGQGQRKELHTGLGGKAGGLAAASLTSSWLPCWDSVSHADDALPSSTPATAPVGEVVCAPHGRKQRGSATTAKTRKGAATASPPPSFPSEAAETATNTTPRTNVEPDLHPTLRLTDEQRIMLLAFVKESNAKDVVPQH